MAIALARKYRPRRFGDLVVQDHVAQVLRGAIARGRVAHGYLLTGPRGVGKTTAARILAMALNCAARDATGEPCGECESCRRIWAGGASLDVVEIDAASNRGVEDARELRERAMYAASREGHHKVYIVDEAHMLTREAWNALLKILEEPPPGVVFVFATTEPQKIAQFAAPVLSRLQRFDFRRIGAAAIRERLRAVLAHEAIPADDDALTLIARHADGGMRDALSLLDQCLSFGDGSVTAARVREVLGVVGDDTWAELLRIVLERDAAAVFPLVDRLADAGADLPTFLRGAGDVLRTLLQLELGAAPEELTEGLRETLERARGRLAPGDLVRMLRLLADDEVAIRRAGSPRLAVETLLLRWALMDRLVQLEEVLAGGEPPASPVPARPRSAPRQRADAAPAPGPAPDALEPTPAPEPPAAPVLAAPFSLEGLQEAWAGLVQRARAESPFLGEALAVAELRAVAPPEVVLAMPPAAAGQAMLLERQQAKVAALLGAVVGAPVTVRLAGEGPSAAAPVRPGRLTEAEIRADRLRKLRQRDATLDAVADELDLEIVD